MCEVGDLLQVTRYSGQVVMSDVTTSTTNPSPSLSTCNYNMMYVGGYFLCCILFILIVCF